MTSEDSSTESEGVLEVEVLTNFSFMYGFRSKNVSVCVSSLEDGEMKVKWELSKFSDVISV